MRDLVPLDPYVVEITRETEEDGFQQFQLIARFKVDAADYSIAEAIGRSLTQCLPMEYRTTYHVNAKEDEEI